MTPKLMKRGILLLALAPCLFTSADRRAKGRFVRFMPNENIEDSGFSSYETLHETRQLLAASSLPAPHTSTKLSKSGKSTKGSSTGSDEVSGNENEVGTPSTPPTSTTPVPSTLTPYSSPPTMQGLTTLPPMTPNPTSATSGTDDLLPGDNSTIGTNETVPGGDSTAGTPPTMPTPPTPVPTTPPPTILTTPDTTTPTPGIPFPTVTASPADATNETDNALVDDDATTGTNATVPGDGSNVGSSPSTSVPPTPAPTTPSPTIQNLTTPDTNNPSPGTPTPTTTAAPTGATIGTDDAFFDDDATNGTNSTVPGNGTDDTVDDPVVPTDNVTTGTDDDTGAGTDDTGSSGGGFDDDFSDTSVQCKNASIVNATVIPILFQYSIEVSENTSVAQIVQEIELDLLAAVAKGVLSCARRLDAPQTAHLRRRLAGAIRISADPTDEPAGSCGDNCTIVDGGMTAYADGSVVPKELQCQIIVIIRNTMSGLPSSIDGLGAITFIRSDVNCDEESSAVGGEVQPTESDDSGISTGGYIGLGLASLMLILLGLLLALRKKTRSESHELLKGDSDSTAPDSLQHGGDNITAMLSDAPSADPDIENLKMDVHRCKSSTCELCALEKGSILMLPVPAPQKVTTGQQPMPMDEAHDEEKRASG